MKIICGTDFSKPAAQAANAAAANAGCEMPKSSFWLIDAPAAANPPHEDYDMLALACAGE